MAARFPEDRSCTRKVRYETWRAAERAARRINHEHDETLSPYWCRFCGGTHIGHRQQPRIRFPRDED